MTEPIKIRAQMKGDIADIRILIKHPNETGLRKDLDSGKLVPAHYIQNITVDVAGRRAVEGHTNITLSANPVLAFKVRNAKVGDAVTVSWVDNFGEQRSDTAALV
jgi:sulfur-oxidizing protein SoxZ